MPSRRFDTRSMPVGLRSSSLQNLLRDTFHLDAQTSGLGFEAFENTLDMHDIGHVSIAAISGSAQQILLSNPAPPRGVFVLFSHTANGSIETDQVHHALLPGCAYLFDAAAPTLIRTTGVFEHSALFVPSAASDLVRSIVDRRTPSPLVLSGAPTVLLNGVLDNVLAHAAEFTPIAAPMVARSMVELLSAALTNGAAGPVADDQRLNVQHRHRVREYALARLSDPEMSVESIAAAVALSTRRIHQLFASDDLTLMRWIWAERLARCHAQLSAATTCDVRIGDLAYEWGFSDPAHFSRAFRQRYGLSPSQVLKSAD